MTQRPPLYSVIDAPTLRAQQSARARVVLDMIAIARSGRTPLDRELARVLGVTISTISRKRRGLLRWSTRDAVRLVEFAAHAGLVADAGWLLLGAQTTAPGPRLSAESRARASTPALRGDAPTTTARPHERPPRFLRGDASVVRPVARGD